MIEREFIKNKLKEFNMRKTIEEVVTSRAGVGGITFEKTPLGEKIIIDTVKPGLVIGRGGETIKKLTIDLKEKFGLENPQIEVRELTNPSLSSQVVAKNIVFDLMQFGPKRFKPLAYRSLMRIMKSGAMGCEIKLSGRIPSQRAKTWRFFAGYMKKCGHVAQTMVDKSILVANTSAGSVGVKVSIMLPETPLPDRVEFTNIIVQQESPEGETLSIEEVPVKTAEAEVELTIDSVPEENLEKEKIVEKPKTEKKAEEKKTAKKTESKPKAQTNKKEAKKPITEKTVDKKPEKKAPAKKKEGEKK